MTHSPQLPQSDGSFKSSLALVIVLAAFCLVLRLIGLLDLPIFGDEAIYLRWAQLIRGGHAWISLVDPKPPLHFWLMALVFDWTTDPLRAARLLSVMAGVATVPLMMAVAAELSALPVAEKNATVTGRTWGIIAALLATFCPFLAFYQRLATADALFVTESLLAIWLILRWARLVVEGPSGGATITSWLTAAGVGLSLGAGLLTRQGLSYTLCAMPLLCAALALSLAPRPRRYVRTLLQFFMIAVIAAVCWWPFLMADVRVHAEDIAEARGGVGAAVTGSDIQVELKRRILYQDAIAGGSMLDTHTITRNAHVAFLPGWTSDGTPNSGWFFVYLTPFVYLLSLAGLIYVAVRRPRAFAVLLVWTFLMLAPVILLGHTVFSRYVLAAVPPLLLLAAYLLADMTRLLLTSRLNRAVGWETVGILWALIFVLPMREVALQTTRWREQTLTEWRNDVRGDRYQYITGWTAGLGTRAAITYLKNLSHEGPIVVITENGWGNAADAAWVYLSREPNVRLYYTDERVLQRAPGNGTAFLLETDKYLFPSAPAVQLPEGIPILYLVNEPARGEARKSLQALSANLGPARTFYGVDGAKGEGVVIFPFDPAGYPNP